MQHPKSKTKPREINRLGREIHTLVTQLVKNLPAMWETWIQFLGWEDPLEKEMATHSRQEYWSGLPFPSPGDLPNPGIKSHVSCIGRQIFFYHLSHQGSPQSPRPKSNADSSMQASLSPGICIQLFLVPGSVGKDSHGFDHILP